MSDIYLSRVHITDFRSFGAVPPIEMIAGPGALLLVGPNGLGKSSWFEAVEVALTGGVRRWDQTLEDMPVQAQARLGRTDWSVQLGFEGADGEAHLVTRTGAGAAGDTPVDQVISLLAPRADQWSLSSSNLRAFLHMTHLLPQSSRLRFLAEADHRVRWDSWLSHVCGFERVARAQANVGAGTKRQISAEVNRREVARTQAQQRIDRWRSDRQALEDAERAQAAIGEAWTPTRARAEIGSLHRVEVLPPPDPEPMKDAIVLAEALVQARGRRTTVIAQLGARTAALEGLRSLPGERADAVQRAAEARSVLEARAAEETERKALLDAASAATNGARAEQDRVAEAKADADRLAAAIQGRRTAAEAVVKAIDALRSVKDLLGGAVERVPPLKTARDAVAGRLEERRRWDAAGSSLSRRVLDLEDAARRLVRARATQADIEKAEEREAELAESLKAQQAQLDDVTRDERKAEEALREQEEALEVHRARNTAIGQAVAALASHVHDTDTKCPLCRHDWERPGLLLEQVQESLKDVDPLLAQAEAGAATKRDDLQRLRAQTASIRATIDQFNSERSAVASAQTRRREELRDLRDHPLLVDGDLAELEPRLASVESQITSDREAWAAAPAAQLAVVAILQSELDAAVDQINVAEADVTRLERVVADAEAAVVAANAAVEVASGVLGEVAPATDASDASLAAALVAQGHAAERLVSVTEQVQLAEERVRRATAEHAAAQERRRAVAMEVTRQNDALEAIRARWSAIGLTEEPDHDALQAAIDDAGRAVEAESEDDALLLRTVEGLARWRADLDLNRRRTQLAAEAGGATAADWDAHLDRLTSDYEARDAAVKRANATRQAVDTLSRRLDQVVKEFRPRLADSLAGPLKVLLPAMIQDERFHDVRLSVAGTGKKSAVAATLPQQAGVEADHLLSEGQMSGVSLAVMLATATAFRWSRWPALLLDDPTQHNDLVHAANLIEVVRMMIVTHGFQVVISTHDRELAEFFQRKLRHAGVQGRTCSFRDPDPAAGVIPSVTGW